MFLENIYGDTRCFDIHILAKTSFTLAKFSHWKQNNDELVHVYDNLEFEEENAESDTEW